MSVQGKIILCADSESLLHPWLMGLDGIDVESFDWMTIFSEADKARAHIASGVDISEVWVVSSNDIESVNLAAALRKDDHELPITLILSKLSGSVLSRASSAGIKTVYTTYEFAERFALEAQRRRRLDEAGSLGYAEIITSIRQKSSKRRKLNIPDVGVEAKPKTEKLKPMDTVVMQACTETSAGSKPSMGDSERADVSSMRPKESVEKNAFVIGMFSGSGGVGKSVISVLSAYLCARKGLKTLLVDADFQFGDLDSLIGKKGSPSADDVLQDFSALESLLQKCEVGIPALVSASKRPESSETLDGHLGELVEAAARVFDVVIVNTGTYWREGHAALLELSDCSVFLMDQRASSVRANNRAIDLCKRMGVATNGFVYALNRCDKKALFSAVDIAGVMDGAHIYELKDGGVEVEESCGAGCAEELLDAASPLVSSLKSMLGDILPDRMRLSGSKAGASLRDSSTKDADGKPSDSARPRSFFFKGGKSPRRRSRFKDDRRLEGLEQRRAGVEVL